MSLANYIDANGFIDLNQSLIVDEAPTDINHATNKLYVDNKTNSLTNEILDIKTRLDKIETYLRAFSETYTIKKNDGSLAIFD